MVKQSCVSTKERSSSVTPAFFSAWFQACSQPSNGRMSRFDIGRKSCTCSLARKATARRIFSAVAVSASIRAAAPSETSEQSVRFSGPATNGFFSLSWRQNSIAEILAHLRIGIVDAVLVVLGGDHRQRVRLVAIALEIGLRDLAEDAGKTGRRVAVLAADRRP